MSTAKEIREFVRPFIRLHPELELRKRLLFRLPVRHCIVGISFEPPHYKGDVLPCWYVGYLFAPPPRSSGGFGGRIDRAVGILGDPDLPDRVFGELERALAEIIPPGTSLETALDVHKHAPIYFGEMTPQSRALLYTALGRFAEAEDALQAEVIRQRRNMSMDIYINGKLVPPKAEPVDEAWEATVVSLETLLDHLRRGDPAPIAALLHEWEAIAAKAWGIERYWEPSPFPFELA